MEQPNVSFDGVAVVSSRDICQHAHERHNLGSSLSCYACDRRRKDIFFGQIPNSFSGGFYNFNAAKSYLGGLTNLKQMPFSFQAHLDSFFLPFPRRSH